MTRPRQSQMICGQSYVQEAEPLAGFLRLLN